MFAGFIPVVFTERRRGLPTSSREPSSSTTTRSWLALELSFVVELAGRPK
jgi:hypothetical protein